MLFKDIFRVLSIFFYILALPLLIPLGMAIYCEWIVGPQVYPQPPCALAFLLAILSSLCLGALFSYFSKGSIGKLYRREALLLVVLIYFLTPFVAAIPFFASQTLKNPLESYFEAISGITTTGATILEAKQYDASGREVLIHTSFLVGDEASYTFKGNIARVHDPKTGAFLEGIDAVSPALIFWRSLMTWLGGGGIIVLMVAILPALGVGGKMLYQTEMSGPTKESLAPRVKETAGWVWRIYAGLTALQFLLLLITNSNMPVFDALTLSLSSISTGGFLPTSGGIQGYHSAATEWVLIAFMVVGSTNFFLYYYVLKGKWIRLNDPELKLFLLVILICSIFATYQLINTYSLSESIRAATFQVVSIQSSTGFATANYDLWPFSIQTLLLVLMFIGGMAGSTSGGIKVVRTQAMVRVLISKVKTIFRPDAVQINRVGATSLSDHISLRILSFFMIVATLAVLGTFFLVVDGVDPETSLTTVGAMMNNVGAAFRMGGPTHSFAFLTDFGKTLSIVWMVAGRLEYFALLVLLVPDFWKQR